MIGAFVDRLAKSPEPSAKRRIFAGKARTGTDVGQIKNQIVDRIRFVFERGGDGESFAGLEETENNAAPRRRSIRFDQTESPPGVGGEVTISTV